VFQDEAVESGNLFVWHLAPRPHDQGGSIHLRQLLQPVQHRPQSLPLRRVSLGIGPGIWKRIVYFRPARSRPSLVEMRFCAMTNR
jgi:hypothetical protein